ncbi:peroxisomal membrane protein PEX14-like isoform X2 [Branchiostoma lanceolatum]|uniref:peroxisomal membrane protein PEX14-like isoform X2 n=1 Tax=Branchiostoma lanceolatum TaxID=7740 RepID=UPI003455280A
MAAPESKSSPKDEGSPSEAPLNPEPRQQMIETAVKFLQNPRVRQSAFTQRRAFLQKKGLTNEEIQLAIEKSGTAADETNPPPPPPAQVVQSTAPVALQPPVIVPVSPWSKWRDMGAVIVLVGGALYGLYRLFQAYLVPLWKSSHEERQRLERIETAVTELSASVNKTVGELQTSVGVVQQTLTKQGDRVQEISMDLTAGKSTARVFESQSVSELKAEITSLKGLLLSRHQFPPTPSPTPIIPSWQMETVDAASSLSGKVTTTSEVSPAETVSPVKDADSNSELENLDVSQNGKTVSTSESSEDTSSSIVHVSNPLDELSSGEEMEAKGQLEGKVQEEEDTAEVNQGEEDNVEETEMKQV